VNVKNLLPLAAALVTLLTGLARTAQGDVVAPGYKFVRHDAVFENVNDFPEYVFFVWPRDISRDQPGNSSVRVAATGEATLGGNPLARAQHGGPFLFAVPKGLFGGDPSQPPRDEWFENPTEGVLKSAALVPEIRSAPLWEPRDRFVTRYRIAIQDGRLDATLLSHEQPGDGAAPGSGRWLIAGGLAVAALALAAGLILVRRRGPKADRAA
jgi:hypothetical protein